ncbi:MAG: magnesium chelatase domain-containing protein [Luteolibacter sp.]
MILRQEGGRNARLFLSRAQATPVRTGSDGVFEVAATEGLGQARGVVLVGVEGRLVEVEAHAHQGMVKFTFVGLADRSVGEARDRARSALLNSGLPWPAMRITIGLSPASIPKSGPTLDLPVALTIAATQDAVPQEALRGPVFLGELGLDGSLRPVRGVLVAALAARRAGVRTLVVPAANAAEARLVDGLQVLAFHTLAGVVAHLRDEPPTCGGRRTGSCAALVGSAPGPRPA